MGMVKKSKNITLPKALDLPPISIALWGCMFPGIGLLNKWLNPVYIPNPAIVCEALPGEFVGLILLSEFIILYIWKRLLIRVNSAIFLISYGAFSFFSIGSIFFLITNVAIFCPPITSEVFKIYPPIFSLLTLSAALIFILNIMPNIKKAIKINKDKINFKEMVFALNTPLTHVSGKKMSALAGLGLTAGLTGLFLSRVMSEYLDDSDKILSLIFVGIFVTFYLMTYLFLGQLYTLWVVWSECKKVGRKMTIKEFNK